MNTRLPFAALFLGLASAALAQIQLTPDRLAYQQNFDGLSNGAWVNNPSGDINTGRLGWYAFSANGVDLALTASAGTPQNLGRMIAFGHQSTTERALGAIPTVTTGDIVYGVRLVNATGAPLRRVTISYVGEQWRIGANNPVPATLRVDYSLRPPGTTSLFDGAWQTVPALAYTGRWVGSNGTTSNAIDGNSPENRELVRAELELDWAPGQELWLRWTDTNARAVNHGLGIDDFSLVASP